MGKERGGRRIVVARSRRPDDQRHVEAACATQEFVGLFVNLSYIGVAEHTGDAGQRDILSSEQIGQRERVVDVTTR